MVIGWLLEITLHPNTEQSPLKEGCSEFQQIQGEIGLNHLMQQTGVPDSVERTGDVQEDSRGALPLIDGACN